MGFYHIQRGAHQFGQVRLFQAAAEHSEGEGSLGKK
jgi:hypothetical protein